MTNQYRFDLETDNCLYCGACASIAPDHFFVDPKRQIARVTKQPQNAEELAACRAAMINCPATAISETAVSAALDVHQVPLG